MSLKSKSFWLVAVACGAAAIAASGATAAPAWPLVSIDPYTSAWMAADTLSSAWPVHWTNHDLPMQGVLTVDGRPYRFLGLDKGRTQIILPHSEQQAYTCRYTGTAPGPGWTDINYDDRAWSTGAAPVGTSVVPHDTWVPQAGTVVENDVWIRRPFSLPWTAENVSVWLDATYCDDAEIYVNGHKMDTGCADGYGALHRRMEIPRQWLTDSNMIAAHASHVPGNYGTIDLGIVLEYPAETVTEPAVQKSVNLTPTATRYEMECGPVTLYLEFLAPLLPDDLELLSRPVNYILYKVRSNDGRKHDIGIRIDCGAEWACNLPGTGMKCDEVRHHGMLFARTGTLQQPVLQKWGDDLRIDWGYLYLGGTDRNATVTTGNDWVGYARNLGKIKDQEGYVLIGYDDIYSMEYFGERLRPYWNRNGDSTISEQLRRAAEQLPELQKRCTDFDARMTAGAERSGGKEYADILALTYRQAIHAHKLLQSPAGELLYLSKENFSNGSVGTVDLTYPSAPLFLLYNPELLKGMMNPIFEYCSSAGWGKPFAAHDIGRYPHANGQNYGGDMPVEESGNMLILTAAIAKREGNADYARPHLSLLGQWAGYLYENGLNPENQLCTDDFAGHTAHNVNLSAKAIMGIASYACLLEMTGDKTGSGIWMDRARDMAAKWMEMADDGDHYRLTFDAPGTWSLKYNLIWDKVLGFNLLPASVYEREIKWYLSKMNQYGVPLDSRERYTKSDWLVWVASMAPDRDTFRKFVQPFHRFLTETDDRIPMTDWYWANRPEARHYKEHSTDKAFRARSVTGGHFMKLYYDYLN